MPYLETGQFSGIEGVFDLYRVCLHIRHKNVQYKCFKKFTSGLGHGYLINILGVSMIFEHPV